MQKIKAELFDNKFYIVKGVNKHKINVKFIDLQRSSFSISPQIFSKNINLHNLDIIIEENVLLDRTNDIQKTYFLYNYIKNEINKAYFKIITELGEKNRINAPMNKLDIINIQNINDDSSSISKKVYSKLISASNYIASEGRLGPAQWLVSNNNTYKYILNYLLDMNLSYDTNDNLLIGNIPYIIDDLIDDDIILIGRKNNIDQPGVICTILTDENDNIITQEYSNISFYQKTLSIFFSVDDIGINQKHQFLKINTRSIGYYRAKKLQRIKELYGE
jgi:hypothetical protein